MLEFGAIKIDFPELSICHGRTSGKGLGARWYGSRTVDSEFLNTIGQKRTFGLTTRRDTIVFFDSFKTISSTFMLFETENFSMIPHQDILGVVLKWTCCSARRTLSNIRA